MRFTLSRKLILAAALILGQWLMVAHAFEHPAISGELACDLCHHGHRLDFDVLPATAAAVAVPARHEPPAVAALPAPRSAVLARYSIRDPPQLPL
jgi:hypothetical protein